MKLYSIVLLTLLLTIPMDSDSLGLYEEIQHTTNPLDDDTDKDGVPDGVEVVEGASPTDKDTDSDGLNDSEELYKYETNASDADSDDDNLSDNKELFLGTDPIDNDTDNDGFTDGYELEHSELSPHHKDVLVEVDRVGSIPREELRYVKSAFDNAPVDNPDGRDGIDLHLYVSNETVDAPHEQSVDYYVNHTYEHDINGAFHVLFVDEVKEGDNVLGSTRGNIDGMVVSTRYSDNLTASVFMHELGHQLGLDPAVFGGIDSKRYSYDTYSSTMNYNCQSMFDCSSFEYSSGEPFDEWELIEKSLADINSLT